MLILLLYKYFINLHENISEMDICMQQCQKWAIIHRDDSEFFREGIICIIQDWLSLILNAEECEDVFKFHVLESVWTSSVKSSNREIQNSNIFESYINI